MRTERFELRLEEDLLKAIDAWRDRNSTGSSRAQAIRALIAEGLHKGNTSRFSDGEKTILAFIAGLSEKIGKPDDRLRLLLDGFSTGNHWAADFEMGSLYAEPSTNLKDAKYVEEILEMWNIFENAFEVFNKEEKSFVMSETEGESNLRQTGRVVHSRQIQFPGFNVNDETNLIHIAAFLISSKSKFSRFRDRNISSDSNASHNYSAKLEFFRQLKDNLIGRIPTPQETRDFTIARRGTSMQEIIAKGELIDRNRFPVDH